MTENVGEDVRGGDELRDENDWSFFLSLTALPFPLAFLTDRKPLPVLKVLTSSGIFADLHLFDFHKKKFNSTFWYQLSSDYNFFLFYSLVSALLAVFRKTE